MEDFICMVANGKLCDRVMHGLVLLVFHFQSYDGQTVKKRRYQFPGSCHRSKSGGGN